MQILSRSSVFIVCTRGSVKQHCLRGRAAEFSQCGDMPLGALNGLKKRLKSSLLFLQRQRNCAHKVTILYFFPALSFLILPSLHKGNLLVRGLPDLYRNRSREGRTQTEQLGTFHLPVATGKTRSVPDVSLISRQRLLSLHGWRRRVNSYLYCL